MSIMGGIGMLSGGLVGSAGLGYAKDRFSSESLNASNPALYAQFKSEKTSSFLFFSDVTGLDGKKLGEAKAAKAEVRSADQKAVVEADQAGDRKTLGADAYLPAAMAAIYLLLLLYFKSIGGYKAVKIEETA